MTKIPFADLSGEQYDVERDATDKRLHLRLVHETIVGGEDAASREAARLTLDYSDVTGGASLVISFLKMPVHLRCFVDAVVAVTGGSPEFVEVTDAELADYLGRSTKTVQNYRNEFREWNDHATLVEIKDNWRDPDSHESHPHRYRAHITKLAVETATEARLDPGYNSDPKRRLKAFKDAAGLVASTAPGYAPRKRKRRKFVSDSVKLARQLQAANAALQRATNLRGTVQNPDFDVIYALREQMALQLAAFDEAYELGAISIQKKEEEYVEAGLGELPDGSSASPCMEVENEGVVEKVSTCLESLCQNCLKVAEVQENKADTGISTRVKRLEHPTNEAACSSCGGATCACLACLETIQQLRAGVRDSISLGLPEDLPPFGYWSEGDGAAFDVVLPAAELTYEMEDNPPEFVCGAATWVNADCDMPVTVTGELGRGPDGRRYVSIAESAAGVPLDEIHFHDSEEVYAPPGDDVYTEFLEGGA